MNFKIKFIDLFNIVILLSYSFSIFLTNYLRNLGLNIPTGFDYIFYFALTLPFLIYKKSIKIAKKYLLGSSIIIIVSLASYYFGKYVINIFWFLLGLFLILLPLYTYILFNNILYSDEKILSFLKKIQIINTILALVVIISLMRHMQSTLIKDIGIMNTSFNINIIISIILFKITKNKYHIFIGIISFFAIISSVMLKTIFSSFIILFLYIIFFERKNIIKSFFALLIVGITLTIVIQHTSVSNKMTQYFEIYDFSNYDDVARLATYYAGFNIAKDHFPLGSAPSTFGSYPVNITYNKIYYDYHLNSVWGLHDKNENDSPSFLLDTYWSSPLAELGFIGFTAFLYLFFFPLFKMKKIKIKSTKSLYFKFYIVATGIVVFIESMTLSIYSQVSYMILYTGISGLLINNLQNSNSDEEYENPSYK